MFDFNSWVFSVIVNYVWQSSDIPVGPRTSDLHRQVTLCHSTRLSIYFVNIHYTIPRADRIKAVRPNHMSVYVWYAPFELCDKIGSVNQGSCLLIKRMSHVDSYERTLQLLDIWHTNIFRKQLKTLFLKLLYKVNNTTFLFKTQFSNFNIRFFLDRIGLGAHVFLVSFIWKYCFILTLS